VYALQSPPLAGQYSLYRAVEEEGGGALEVDVKLLLKGGALLVLFAGRVVACACVMRA